MRVRSGLPRRTTSSLGSCDRRPTPQPLGIVRLRRRKIALVVEHVSQILQDLRAFGVDGGALAPRGDDAIDGLQGQGELVLGVADGAALERQFTGATMLERVGQSIGDFRRLVQYLTERVG